MEHREWFFMAAEGLSSRSMWQLLMYLNSVMHWACFVIVQQRMSCSVEGRRSEKRGASFIMRFVVCLNAVLGRALWMRLTAEGT